MILNKFKGPRRRSYVEVTSSEIETNVWKKNILWALVRLHAAEKQTFCGLTGFNVLVRKETGVSQDNIGYLPTTDVPATKHVYSFRGTETISSG